METKDVHAIKYKMSKAKERCMAYFRFFHSYLQVLSKEDLKGTRIEHGFKRAFMSLFGQDSEAFTSTMVLNVDQLQKLLDKDEFQEDGSMAAFRVLNRQFQQFIDSHVTLDYDGQMTDKYNQKEVDDLKELNDSKQHVPLALMAKFYQSFQLSSVSPRGLLKPGRNMGQDRRCGWLGQWWDQFRQYACRMLGIKTGIMQFRMSGIRCSSELVVSEWCNQMAQLCSGITNQNPNRNGNVVAARAEGHCNSDKEKDAADLTDSVVDCKKKKQESISKQKELDLMALQADLDELRSHANCILMSNLQSKHRSGTQTDNAPSMIQTESAEFLGTVRFGNDHVAAILGFGDLQWGNILITRVYFVEGLGHNLFSVGQFCDSDLEVAFRRNTCFVRTLEGVDLLKGNRSTNLYTIKSMK
ncbi:hypothetical protein Tco_0504874 [Tanacetum coccineum]